MSQTWSYLSTIALVLVGILLIFIILLQRGRGGGLAGAFGGLGGQSAFGTKAGDVFTKITIVLAVIWVALAGLSGFAMVSEHGSRFKEGDQPLSISTSEKDSDKENDESTPYKKIEFGDFQKSLEKQDSASQPEKKQSEATEKSPSEKTNDASKTDDAKAGKADDKDKKTEP